MLHLFLWVFVYLLIGAAIIVFLQVSGRFKQDLTHNSIGQRRSAEEVGGQVSMLILLWPVFVVLVFAMYLGELIGKLFIKLVGK